jgi:hypothetical protein
MCDDVRNFFVFPFILLFSFLFDLSNPFIFPLGLFSPSAFLFFPAMIFIYRVNPCELIDVGVGKEDR